MNQNRLIQKRIAAIKVSTHRQKIPQTIFQTFKTNNVPPGMYKAAMSWVDNNPDYAYSFSDDADCRSLIQQHFDANVLLTYDKLNVGAFKADLWRYCALYVHGGVYADLDTVSKCPLQDIINEEDEFISVFAGAVSGGIFNAFICSIPGHIFLKRAIEEAVRRVLFGGADHPLAITGPLCLGRAINMEIGRDKETEFTEGQHTVNGHSFKILEKVRSPDPNKRSVACKGRTVLMCKYDGYESDLTGTKQRHWMEFFSK